MNEEIRRFSLRKLSVGLASVLVGVSIFGASQTVKADTAVDQTASAVTGSVQSKDTQENKNATESSFSNDNQADNAKSKTTQTQENEPKQVQAENVQQDSVPETQETTDNKDLGAEKGIVHTSPLQEPDNQSNTVTGKTVQHDTFESGQKTHSFNLLKNSQKLVKKALATNLIETNSLAMTNGGFDEATWGKLDVNDWQGSVQDGVYQLTDYTGDLSHIIVPNEADFEKAGKSTNGLQVGIDTNTLYLLFLNQEQTTIAFSKTNNEKVKAIGTDWSYMFSFDNARLSKFDGSNLDVSGVTNMSYMFYNNSISDLSSLANWDVSNVTDMSEMFWKNKVSDLTPLVNWNVSNVRNMADMFRDNSISDLTPLANWKTSKVTNMRSMFENNLISNLTPLAHWNTSNVTNMSEMFNRNSISDLIPLAHWNTSAVTNMDGMFESNQIRDLTPLANWKTSKVTNMRSMFENNLISNLTPLAHWNTSNVTNMSEMFNRNSISDLIPLAHWNTSAVTDMHGIFYHNSIGDLTPLTNWDTSKVTNMDGMFESNQISDLTPLTNWDISKVTNMGGMGSMFGDNPDLIDLGPIANWDISGVDNFSGRRFSGLFRGDTKLDLTNINNTPLMQGFLKKPYELQGTTFIINNVDFVTELVKATTGKDVPTLTNTATRTIVFNIPNGDKKTVTQHIYYKAIAPVQIDWPTPPRYMPSADGIISKQVMIALNPPLLAEKTPIQSDPNNSNPTNPYSPKIIKTYPVKDPDWQLDDSDPAKQNDAITVNGQVYFKPVPIPHVNGYKAHLVRNPFNPVMFMVSFMAVPTENKPSTPVEVTPSKPSASVDNPSKPFAPVDNPNKPADDLQKHVAAKLNSNDLGWTMPTDVSNSTYTVEVPADDAIIDLSDLVIAEPVHAQTRTQIHVNKHFKLSKKHSIKYLKHRKKAVRQFKKYRL